MLDMGSANTSLAPTRPQSTKTSPVVQAMGHSLVARLHRRTPATRPTRDTGLQRGDLGPAPAGRGHITAHRNPSAYGGVVAMFTLAGHARFRVWTNPEEVSDLETGPGQLVLLRGAGLQRPASPRSTRSTCPNAGTG